MKYMDFGPSMRVFGLHLWTLRGNCSRINKFGGEVIILQSLTCLTAK